MVPRGSAERLTWTLARAHFSPLVFLVSALAPLRNNDTARRRKQDGRNKTLFFEPNGGLADNLEMRTGIMDHQQAARVQLRQQPANLCFTVCEMAVAIQQIDHAFDVRLKARLQPRFDPGGQSASFEAFLGPCANGWIKLDRDDLAETIFLQALRQLYRAMAKKRARLDDQFWLYGGDQRLQEIEDFDFRSLRVEHSPQFRLWTFGSGRRVFRLHDLLALRDTFQNPQSFVLLDELRYDSRDQRTA